MLDLVYGVKIFFWWLGYVNLDGVHVMFRFDQDIAFLHVFVDVYFDFDTIAGDAANGMFLEFVTFEQNVDYFFIGAVMDGPKNTVANHLKIPF